MLANQSLLTIDQTRRGRLLPAVSSSSSAPQPVTIVWEEAASDRAGDVVVHTLDNVLSPAECDSVVRSAADQFGLASVAHSYTNSVRQADRLCILDNDLAALIWQRLTPIRSKLQLPGGRSPPAEALTDQAETSEGWQAARLNECCRLSRYTAPSVGFTPHFDSPYVPSAVERSALSVVVYLSDEGSTDFYLTPEGGADVLGLTTVEEIAVRGGLGAYRKHTVQAKQGRCVIFPHELLHAGAPVEVGTKWVLRTDVVFSSSGGDSLPRSGGYEHGMAVEWFREAQNQELDGNVHRASELYERTLSLRLHAHASTATLPTTAASVRRSVPSLDASMWSQVLFFLDDTDLAFAAACSKSFQAWCERNNAIADALWHKHHPQLRSLRETITSVREAERAHPYYVASEPRIQRQIEAHMPHHLPRFQSRHGSLCIFRYTRAVFDSEPAACLRALAMAAVFQFGVSAKSQTYVAQYDAVRGRALACSAQELLDAAFHERLVGGQWYHVHRNDDAALTQTTPVSASNAVTPSPREALARSVDPELLRPPDREEEKHAAGFEPWLEQGRTKYAAAVESSKEQLTGYTRLIQSTTSLYKFASCDHNRAGIPNRCWHEDKWGTVPKPVYYNNLICDFSRSRLHVQEEEDGLWTCSCQRQLVEPLAVRHWTANLEPLSLPSFQHAACQWQAGTKQPGTQSHKRGYDSQHSLLHLHLFQIQMSNAEGELKGGEQESDSEVYDEYERPFWGDFSPLEREQLDVDSMLAPQGDEADYTFVSQYAAIHTM